MLYLNQNSKLEFMHEVKDRGAVNEHLANEPIYLALIRTSLVIMLFRFLVVKFALFIKPIQALPVKKEMSEMREYSAFLGIIDILIGSITAILSYIRFKHTKNQLKEGQYVHSSGLITIFIEFIRSVRCLNYCIPYSKYLI